MLAVSASSRCSDMLPIDERERLILEHMPQVKLIARKIHAHIQRRVDLEDLISTGIIGLITAIDRYDPTRELKLRTYAEYKIRGAILDSLRVLDNATREERRKAKLIEKVSERIEQRLQRTSTHDEVASEIGISLEAYNKAVLAVANSATISLDANLSNDESDSYTSMRFAQGSEQSPEEALAGSQLRKLVADAIAGLGSQEAKIVALVYGHGLTMREAAPLLKMSEWQVQEGRRKAIAKLRSRLAESWNGGLLPSAPSVQASPA